MGAAPGPPAGWASRSHLSGREPTTLSIMLNPGAAQIPDADPELAETNMAAFAAAVADHGLEVGQPERDESADADGRYGYVLAAGDRSVRVRMPGVPLAAVRDMSTSAPCLYVEGEAWWWPSAVTVAAALMR